GRCIQIIAGLQTIGPDAKVSLDDEQLFAAGMIVQRHARAGIDAQEKRRRATGLVVAQALDREPGGFYAPPALLRASHDTHLSLQGPEEYQINAAAACLSSDSSPAGVEGGEIDTALTARCRKRCQISRLTRRLAFLRASKEYPSRTGRENFASPLSHPAGVSPAIRFAMNGSSSRKAFVS